MFPAFLQVVHSGKSDQYAIKVAVAAAITVTIVRRPDATPRATAKTFGQIMLFLGDLGLLRQRRSGGFRGEIFGGTFAVVDCCDDAAAAVPVSAASAAVVDDDEYSQLLLLSAEEAEPSSGQGVLQTVPASISSDNDTSTFSATTNGGGSSRNTRLPLLCGRGSDVIRPECAPTISKADGSILAQLKFKTGTLSDRQQLGTLAGAMPWLLWNEDSYQSGQSPLISGGLLHYGAGLQALGWRKVLLVWRATTVPVAVLAASCERQGQTIVHGRQNFSAYTLFTGHCF